MLLAQAMDFCKERGYISRDSNPLIHYWKNSSYWERLPIWISDEEKIANDWETHDPEGEEYSITA